MKTFKKQLDELADYALEVNGIKNDYVPDDMVNASLVFMEVLASLTFDNHSKKLNIEQMSILMEEIGSNIRQTILLATGLDMHEVVKKFGEDNK